MRKATVGHTGLRAREFSRDPLPRAGLWAACACLSLLGACHHAVPSDLAAELIAEKKYEEAESVLREAVEANPGDLDLQLQFGSLLLDERRCNQAVWPLLRAAASEDLAATAAPLVVRCLVQTNNHADAIAVLDRIVDRNPEDAAIRQMRAHSLIANHQETEALADLDWLIAHGPGDDDFEILELKLRALLQLQRAGDAQSILDELRSRPDTASSPDRAPRLCAVDANFTAERQEVESARKKFEACLGEFPDSELVAFRAVRFFDAEGDGDRGTAILEAALEERPESPALIKALADRLRALGQADEALALLKSARSEKLRREIAVLLAEHHMELDDPASALRDLEWVFEAESDEALFAALPEAHRFMLGDILVLLKENERVRRLIPHIQEPAYRQFLEARMSFEAGRYEQALAEFDEGFRIWPSSAGPRYLAGEAAEQIGDFNAATDHYRASVRSDASASDAGLALARIYAAQGSWLAAVEALQYHFQAHPRDAEALRLLAELQIRLGNKSFASQLRAQLSELPGQRDVALADHARNLATWESPGVALSFIEENAKRLFEPEYLESLAVWCELMSSAGRAEEALRRLSGALRPPQVADSRLRTLEAQLLVALDREPEARSILEAVVAEDPEGSWGLLGLARLNAKQGRIDEAIALYDRAATVDANEPLASLEAGRLLVGAAGQGDALRGQQAEVRLREALRREPTLGEAALLLVRMSLHPGVREGARGEPGDEILALALRAARFAAGSESAELLAEVYLARDEPALAVEVLERAIAAGAAEGRTHYLSGRALSATGETAAARAAFARALESGPFDEWDQARIELARMGGPVRRDAM